MSEAIHPVPYGFNARIGPRELAELHDLAAADPDRFWLDQARRLTWNKFPTKAGDWSFDEDDFHIHWYADGELNLSVNCLDRHLAEHGDRTALIFEADEPGEGHRLTYRELYEETCRFANLLKSARHRARRSGDDLHADDPRSGGGDARLRAHRRDPFGGVRRLLAREPCRPHRRLRRLRGDHRRRGRPRRQAYSLERNVDTALEERDVQP